MDNLKADAFTRARQLAVERLKSVWRDEGRAMREFSTTAHRTAIAALANDPTILARATADVEQWRKYRVPRR